MKIAICGGGTGGHVYPALAAAGQLKAKGIRSEQIIWIGTKGQMEETLVPQAGLKLATIAGGPIVGVPFKAQLMNGGRLVAGFFKALSILRAFKPSALFMTGGYVNVPVALAARLLRIPSGIYLPDVEPGSAIKSLSRHVDKVACTTAASRQYFKKTETVVTGYPVRASLLKAKALSKANALAQFHLADNRQTLFVFGGSRGAQTINRALMAILPQLLESFQVIHVSGTLTWPEVEENKDLLTTEQRRYYRPYPYLHAEMGAAFRAADLIVARGGASMLGEGPAFGVPAILVPYPFAWRYQKVNADYLADKNAAIRLNDEEMAAELLPTINSLMNDSQKLKMMRDSAEALAIHNADEKLAQFIIDLAGGAIHD